ncbi:MAG TPA: hypothetical protein VJW76_00055 [Verrucomicrobiae bacterium]|nr:hypothetical protein [Verrucomicrobiae bacterium]
MSSAPGSLAQHVLFIFRQRRDGNTHEPCVKNKNANHPSGSRLNRLRSCLLSLLALTGSGALTAAESTPASSAEQKFETIQAGSQTFSNVTVVSRSARQITIMHAKGVASLKLEDLTPDVQAKLGYDPANPGGKGKGVSFSKTFSAQSERAREARARADELLQQHGAALRLAAAVGLPLLYLFCCFCFLQVCRKAGVNAPFKVWIPLLQFDPLFKAAGMSRIALFWFMSPLLFAVWAALFVLIASLAGTPLDLFKGPKLTMFAGGLQGMLAFVGVMVGFVWCFKICIARGKRAWMGIFLILPLINLLMLCYLAFSAGAKEPPRRTGQLKLA